MFAASFTAFVAVISFSQQKLLASCQCGSISEVCSKYRLVDWLKHSLSSDHGLIARDIRKIALFCKTHNLRPRLSCLLLKEGIHDLQGIISYLNFYKDLGIDNVIFRETMDYSEEDMINREKMRYLKENKVKLNDIWKEIDRFYFIK